MKLLRVAWIQLKYSVLPFFYLPWTLARRVILGRDRYFKQYFWDKWGVLDKRVDDVVRGPGKVIWIDAASGGEILQIVTFIRRLKERHPDVKIILSTASDDAYHYAGRLSGIDFVFNTPWDFAWVAEKVLRRIHPAIFISIEFTRIPMHFKTAQRAGIKTVLLSGLMSCDWQRHPTMDRAYALEYYRYFDLIGAKERRDMEGFAAFGIDRAKIKILGNMKFDIEELSRGAEHIEDLRKDFQIKSADKIFLAASVFPPEDEVVIDAYVKMKQKINNMRFIIAPRFKKDIPRVIGYLKQYKLSYLCRSELKKAPLNNDNVIIIDTFGELKKIYHLADYIFLSGSIWPVNAIGGGKNIVEPLVSKKPIFFGPCMNYWKEIIGELKTVYEKCEVRNAEELAEGIFGLEDNPGLRQGLRAKAEQLLEQRSGIIKNNVEAVEALL
ncbi:MAG: glycosyltransferase N-terminal domain-containing protein [Candidatus Omnitrophota bacterium]